MDLPVTSQLRYFLHFNFWEEGKSLLDYQIQQIDSNKHYNTLSIFYYKQLFPYTSVCGTENYFKERVSNNLFYGLEHEFAICTYYKPKSGLGLRNYKFLTYPLRVLYYAIGLYLLKVSEEFINEYFKRHPNLESFYGGKLHYKANKLIVNSNTIFYRNH